MVCELLNGRAMKSFHSQSVRPRYLSAVALLATGCAVSAADPESIAQSKSGLTTSTTTSGGSTAVDPLAGAPSRFKLLVIAPQGFKSALAPLVDYKNSTQMPSFVATMEDIRTMFPHSQVDDAFRIKQLIAQAVLTRGVKYVMLAGDATLIPARHYAVKTIDETVLLYQDIYFPTDFYYADLFRAPTASSGSIFSDWDADGDGKYNVMYGPDASGPLLAYNVRDYNPDQVDGWSDVAVARVPAHAASHVTTFVNKVIAYESGRAMPTGGTFGFIADANYGGSDSLAQGIEQQAALSNIVAPSRVRQLGYNFTSSNPPPAGWPMGTRADVSSMLSSSLWVNYVGHGYRWGWDNYSDGDVNALTNGSSLPIVFAAACESGAFKPSIYYEYYGADQKMHWIEYDSSKRTAWDVDNGNAPLSYPIEPPAMSIYDQPTNSGYGMAYSWLVTQSSGAIAYFGDTIVTQDPQPTKVSGHMLQAYMRGSRVLGDVWLAGQRGYWEDMQSSQAYFDAPRSYLSVLQFAGDPSLRLPNPVTALNDPGPRVAYTPGDFNGDGATDVVITNSSGSYWYVSDGAGRFSQPYVRTDLKLNNVAYTPGDFNGDGRTDLVVTNASGSYWYFSNGNGTFSQPYVRNDLSLGSVAYVPGDFNGDGRTDLVVTNYSGSFWYVSNGNGTWTQPYTRSDLPIGSVAYVAGDFNGDRRTDLVVTNVSGSYWYFSNGDGTWNQPYWRGDLPLGSVAYVPGDFNGDGRTDLVVTNASGSYWYFSKGNGTWTQPYVRKDLTLANVMYTPADFNRDRRMDLIVSNASGSYWYFSNGNGTFSQPYVRTDLPM